MSLKSGLREKNYHIFVLFNFQYASFPVQLSVQTRFPDFFPHYLLSQIIFKNGIKTLCLK